MRANIPPINGLKVSAAASVSPAAQATADRRRAPAAHRDDQRDQAQRAGRCVLRRVPQRARQIVDAQAVEHGARHRVDVHVAQRVERAARPPEPLQDVGAFGARREEHEADAHRGQRRARASTPREDEHRRHEQQPGAHRVDEQPRQRIVAEERRRRRRDGRRDEKVGPVVVQRSDRPCRGCAAAMRSAEARSSAPSATARRR